MRKLSRRRQDRKKDGKDEGSPGWLTTYGDLMTLLLCFFVLIVSFSSIQMIEFQKALGSLKGALGILKYKDSPINPTDINLPVVTEIKLENKLGQMKEFIRKKGIQDSIKMKISKEGIAFRMMEPILFDLGKAKLKPSVYPILKKIGELVKDWPNKTRVEGHTDDLPIKTAKYPSNWELSAIRAINVIHFFEDHCKIDPKKLYYRGYGENKPLVPNNSPKNRAKNRRVEICLENSEEKSN